MVQKYLGLKHEYGTVDCIELIRLFYKNELSIEFPLPPYPHSRAWLKHFSTEHVDRWASTCALKVKLTDAENYDVIAFKSLNSNLVMHFGLFLKPTQILHIEEGGVSRIETLSNYWVKRIYALYRHESMVQ
jgi:cell wall-associated NlpC family hydrolase|tara:strand:+ start:1534 stop:1926 length:393 start_codon:yes stop_codon:yes gene_type:complete